MRLFAYLALTAILILAVRSTYLWGYHLGLRDGSPEFGGISADKLEQGCVIYAYYTRDDQEFVSRVAYLRCTGGGQRAGTHIIRNDRVAVLTLGAP